MNPEKGALKILDETGAVLTNGHFLYTSGKHGGVYINKDAVYPHTRLISKLCRMIAEHFSKQEIDGVVAPVVGGVILSQWVSHHLSELKGKEVLGIYAEKSMDGFLIQRGYDRLIPGKKILIVEDILNTGGSVKKVVETVRGLNGDVIGVGALVNRGGVTPKDLGNSPNLYALVNLNLEAWDPKECPLCQKKIPINTEVGKGKK
ncbi:MAG: orotate phosphoribosyltransferase [Deltaproteobacteria bacterium]|nr:orotate phosphoribosyltransferase [Deltaproteobacteria bacterium]